MKALSIRQPWAWLIVNGHKDIENRTWVTHQRGRFLVHAGQTMTRREYQDVVDFLLDDARLEHIALVLPNFSELERGGIVGEATLVECLVDSPSPWFMGEIGLVVRDAKPLPFARFKGQLGFFEVPWPLPLAAPAPDLWSAT